MCMDMYMCMDMDMDMDMDMYTLQDEESGNPFIEDLPNMDQDEALYARRDTLRPCKRRARMRNSSPRPTILG